LFISRNGKGKGVVNGVYLLVKAPKIKDHGFLSLVVEKGVKREKPGGPEGG